MAGMLDLETTFTNQGMAGIKEASNNQSKIKTANNNLESAAATAKKAGMATAAGTGATIGASVAGGMTGATAGMVAMGAASGVGIGLAVAYLAYEYL